MLGFFWVAKKNRDFLGLQKKTGIFWGCKKRSKGFFLGMLKKVVNFLGKQNF